MTQPIDLEALGAKLAEDYSSLRAEISQLSEAVAELANKRADQIEGQIKSVGAEMEASIERHPYSAVLVALGVGVLLGLASRRR